MNNSIVTINPQLNIQKNSHTLFWSMLLVFLTMFFVRNALGISFPVIIYLVYFAIMAFVSDRDEMLALLAVCIPTTRGFQYKYAIVVWIVIYAIRFKDDVKLNTSIIPLLAMMVWEMLHGIKYDFSFVLFLKNFTELILLTFLMCLSARKIDFVFIARILAFSTAVIGCIILFELLKNNHFNISGLFDVNGYRFGKGSDEAAVAFGLDYNPNGIGGMCSFSIVAILLIRYLKKQTLLDYLVLVVLIVIGGLTISRSFILTTIGIFVCFSLVGNKSGSGRLKTLFVFSIVAVVVYFVVINYLPFVFDSFTRRFEVDDITNGRSGLIDFYDEHIHSAWEYSLFGVGIQNLISKIVGIYGGTPVVPHNSVQEIIVAWGYPGLFMFLIMIVFMIYSAGKSISKSSIVNFFPLVVILVTSFAGQFITAGWKLLMLSFAYITLLNNFFWEEEENE